MKNVMTWAVVIALGIATAGCTRDDEYVLWSRRPEGVWEILAPYDDNVWRSNHASNFLACLAFQTSLKVGTHVCLPKGMRPCP
jgi:hypothetical protein